jgi:hypothetical protein
MQFLTNLFNYYDLATAVLFHYCDFWAQNSQTIAVMK